LVGEQDRGFIVAQILNEQLAEGAAGQRNLLIEDAGSFEFAGGDVEFDGAPSRTRQQHDLFHQLGRPSAESDKGNPHLVQPCQVGVGGEAGIEDQMAGQLSVGALPERDEVEDLLGFFAFTQIGIGVTEC